jgi:hypothetical protein
MADKKISALTGATTPLDGTEVLPIVQSGATVKVANNDLRPKQIQSNATSGVLQVAGPASASTRVMTTPDANFTVARTDAAQSLTGNQTLSTGNLIQGTAARGFSFTANTAAAGVTSQLLNWYEEGTFDPRLSFATGGDTFSYNARSATYTRVGRLVTLNLLIDTSAKGAGTGNLSLINLPFTAAGYTSVVPRTVGITNTGPISAYTYSGQSSLLFFTVSSLGVETQITDTSVGAAVTLVMSLTYITS